MSFGGGACTCAIISFESSSSGRPVLSASTWARQTRNRDREVVVDALLQLVQHGHAVGGGEVDLRLPDGVECARQR
jgi:hypothetical protein